MKKKLLALVLSLLMVLPLATPAFAKVTVPTGDLPTNVGVPATMWVRKSVDKNGVRAGEAGNVDPQCTWDATTTSAAPLTLKGLDIVDYKVKLDMSNVRKAFTDWYTYGHGLAEKAGLVPELEASSINGEFKVTITYPAEKFTVAAKYTDPDAKAMIGFDEVSQQKFTEISRKVSTKNKVSTMVITLQTNAVTAQDLCDHLDSYLGDMEFEVDGVGIGAIGVLYEVTGKMEGYTKFNVDGLTQMFRVDYAAPLTKAYVKAVESGIDLKGFVYDGAASEFFDEDGNPLNLDGQDGVTVYLQKLDNELTRIQTKIEPGISQKGDYIFEDISDGVYELVIKYKDISRGNYHIITREVVVDSDVVSTEHGGDGSVDIKEGTNNEDAHLSGHVQVSGKKTDEKTETFTDQTKVDVPNMLDLIDEVAGATVAKGPAAGEKMKKDGESLELVLTVREKEEVTKASTTPIVNRVYTEQEPIRTLFAADQTAERVDKTIKIQDYYEIILDQYAQKLDNTIIDAKTGAVYTTALDEFGNIVLHIVLPYANINKAIYDTTNANGLDTHKDKFAIYRFHDAYINDNENEGVRQEAAPCYDFTEDNLPDTSKAVRFTKLNAIPTQASDFKDATYFADPANKMLHIFTTEFSMYAIAYEPTTSGGGGGGGGTTPTYKVTYNIDGKTDEFPAYKTTGPVPFSVHPNPTKPDATFDGWYRDSARTEKVTGDFTITQDVVLYGHWVSSILETEIHFAYIIGYPDGTVRPTRNISREEVATIFYRLLRDDVRNACASVKNDFTDILPERWSNEIISTMANGGYIVGYADGTFKGEQFITRAEFATMATRFAHLTAGEATFSDISGHWAEEYIKKAAAAGWITGDGDGKFRPDDLITRAEAMTLVNRMLSRSTNAEGMHKDTVLWSDNASTEWYYYIVEEATNSHTYKRQADGINETWLEIKDNEWYKTGTYEDGVLEERGIVIK